MFSKRCESVKLSQANSLGNLLRLFKSYLANENAAVIKATWDKNDLLRSWYRGESVNFGNDEVADMRIISLDELITHFKLALASQVSYVITAIWEGNPLLPAWYSSRPVNFGNDKVVDIRIISPEELIKEFKSVLALQVSYVIKAMWDGNPLLAAWYRGHPVNFGNDEVADMRIISPDELIKHFKSALASHSRYIVKAMWKINPLLPAWYRGRPVNFGNDEVVDIRIISLEELIKDFKAALASQVSYAVTAMWDGNPLLPGWYSGKSVNFSNNEVADMRAISLAELIKDFKCTLTSRISYVSKAMWNGNPLLPAWYSGHPVNFGNDEVADIRIISLEERIKDFKFALTSRLSYIIKAMWNKNSLLPAWYSGRPVNFGNDEVADMRTISLDELITYFKSALASQISYAITVMWDGNPLLPGWYSGRPVNFGTNELPNVRIISLDELINNFKSALASHNQDTIKAMWDGNERLHHAIQGLGLNKSEALLKKVMSSSKEGKSDFISRYVNELDKATPLNKVLKDIQKSCLKKTSPYKSNQMDVLRSRLTKLRTATNQFDGIAVTEKRSSGANATILDVATSQVQSSTNTRRRAPSKSTQRGSKKRKIAEITQAELSDLVSKIPTELNEQNNFCVTEELGKRLQKLPKTIKDEWGIKSIRKIRAQSEYRVVAEKLKYKAFLIKHSPLLLEDSIPDALHNNRDINQDHASDFLGVLPQHDAARDSVEKEHEHVEIVKGYSVDTSDNVEFLDLNDGEDFFFNLPENDGVSTSNLTPLQLSSQHAPLWSSPNSQHPMDLQENNTFTPYDGLNHRIEEDGMLLFNPSDELNQSSMPVPNPKEATAYQFTLFGHSYTVQNPSPLPRNNKNSSLNLEAMDDRMANGNLV